MTQKSLPPSVRWPDHWENVPLWSIFERVKDVGHPHESMLSVYREHGVVLKDARTDNANQTAENRNIYQLVHPGWLIVNRMKAWQGSVGISNYRGIASGHYLCFRNIHGENSRFLNWLLRSGVYAKEYARMSRGVRPGQIEIDNDELRSLRVAVPPIGEQERIADFLDAELTELDRLHEARLVQLRVLRQRWESWLATTMDDLIGRYGWLPMRRVMASIEQGWSPLCDEMEADPVEWAVLKTSAVSAGIFTSRAHKRLPAGMEPDLRYEIADGDILMTRGSGSAALVGVAAEALTEGRRLLLSDLLYRIKLDPTCSPGFVVHSLQSRPVRARMELLFRGQSGQTIKLRSEDVRAIEIPAVPSHLQAKLSAPLALHREQLEEAVRSLRLSLELLSERRRSLITAAVTGQLDLSTASGASI